MSIDYLSKTATAKLTRSFSSHADPSGIDLNLPTHNAKPKFDRDETVSFIGGIGKIKSIQRQNANWTYTVQMDMGKKPNFGRLGAETTILLEEQDLRQSN